MTNHTMELMYGLKPVHRDNPQAGESEWYYYDPRGTDNFSDMKKIDVPSENSPNPYADEIQNYLYKNDRYNYNQLYGTTPPPEQKVGTWDNVKTWGNNFADATEAATVGYATGATLGNFDEAMGAATAAVTLNPDNYTMGRDAVRKLQNDLSHRHPYLYNGMEFFGAMRSPSYALSKEAFANKILNAGVGTLMASLGYAETPKDFLINLPVYGIANTVGSIVDNIPLWRASVRPLVQFGRKFIKQGINSSADKLKNIYYNDDEKYHY